ncbi:MAG: SAV_6107 family HEPN domain-containing protein [Candidatus Binatia bacterium]
MTWGELEQQRRVVKEPAGKSDIDELRAMAVRNLQDASLEGLSPDGRFSLAYNAARCLATIAVRASGYRLKQTGGAHYNTFLALPVAMGTRFDTVAIYFDSCRQSRNDLSYGAASVVSESDSKELVAKAEAFLKTVDAWLLKNHPTLV